MPNTIRSLIRSIIDKRHDQLPALQERIDAWRATSEELRQTLDLVSTLPPAIREAEDVRLRVRELSAEGARRDIQDAIAALEVVARRFQRETVNVGVSGQARTGKSTLLQSISGLGDDQIPSGSGLPVTAVRSRIFHVPGHARAILTFHTYESYAREVLAPLHAATGLPSPPAEVTNYGQYRYPEADATWDQTVISLLQRLRGMQASLDSYRDDLVGGQRVIPLDELRPYVAYPSLEAQQGSPTPPRRYLAVRDVRIETEFPNVDVDGVGLIDLPGLGEVSAEAETRHVEGLRDDVDVVILVKRPIEGGAFWKQEDASAVRVLDIARGDAGARRDFVFILINVSPQDDPRLVQSLVHDVLQSANEGHDGRHFNVLRADSADPQSAASDVLEPVLHHLSQKLPDMDRQVLAGAVAQTRDTASRLLAAVDELARAVVANSRVVGSVRADVTRRAKELHRGVAVQLRELTRELGSEASPDGTDLGFVSAVEEAADLARQWIEEGFDAGDPAKWRVNALREMSVQGGPFKVTEDAFNSARVGIAERFASIDSYLNEVKVPALHRAVVERLSEEFGGLIPPGDPKEQLELLMERVEDCPDPCPTLARALGHLLRLRFDFRYQTYPRIRDELDHLRLQYEDPDTGELRPQITVQANEAGIQQLQSFLRQRALQATYETQKAIIGDLGTPARVIHSAAELFEDAFIRATGSEEEFQNIAHAYRDEIWPGIYEGIDASNARVRGLAAKAQSLKHNLGGLRDDAGE